jgi:DNA-binding LytR/AlgR family response regulator
MKGIMKATALIAEDEPLLAENLRAELIRQWPDLSVAASVANGEAAVERALALRPDVLFLDIRMPGMNGLEAAQALAEDWPDDAPFPLLVFVTAYDQYAVQAFERQAVDYLLKPITSDRMAQCCARLVRTLAERKAAPQAVQQTVDQLRALLGNTAGLSPPAPTASRLEVIQAGVGDTVHMVPVEEVIYFEAADKYVRVVTANKEHLIRTSLRELLPRLDPQRFWQVHRSTIVQARCVQSAHREESGKVVLTVRGRSEKIVASRLYAHLFKGM